MLFSLRAGERDALGRTGAPNASMHNKRNGKSHGRGINSPAEEAAPSDLQGKSEETHVKANPNLSSSWKESAAPTAAQAVTAALGFKGQAGPLPEFLGEMMFLQEETAIRLRLEQDVPAGLPQPKKGRKNNRTGQKNGAASGCVGTGVHRARYQSARNNHHVERRVDYIKHSAFCSTWKAGR